VRPEGFTEVLGNVQSRSIDPKEQRET
jgi:hypothetical protein